MPIHTDKCIIDNKFTIIFLFKAILGDRKNDVISVTITCIYCDKTLHFKYRVAHNNNIHW